jgi:hypothetical protein
MRSTFDYSYQLEKGWHDRVAPSVRRTADGQPWFPLWLTARLEKHDLTIFEPGPSKHSGFIGAGVEPDPIVVDFGRGFHPTMAVDDALFERLGPIEKGPTDPQQILCLLAGERDARAYAGMDEGLIAEHGHGLQFLQDAQVRRRHPLQQIVSRAD